ncbi:MAG: hypothetical protein HY788_09740 [Deltaproteobacteria bacterium]|nr:hypothetical protein [Deltaproteobacteria bacterium]
MIKSYSFGQMKIDGEVHRQDLKIVKGRVLGNWWRNEDHRLDTDDVRDILSAGPDILVVGTGYSGNMRVEESLRSLLEERGTELIAETTTDAVHTFNKLVSEGKEVAGAFHLTC